MRGTDYLQCIVPSCDNQATETLDINGKPAIIFCICHKLNHVLKVKEYSNAYSLIVCETSTCSYEERVEVAVGCKEIGPREFILEKKFTFRDIQDIYYKFIQSSEFELLHGRIGDREEITKWGMQWLLREIQKED